MDPLVVLQNRIAQLEAKLGVPADGAIEGQQGDTATGNLLNTAQAINVATAQHEKLSEAMPIATELNNYTDPNYVENLQQNNMHMEEVAASEQMIRHHCKCMHHCKQAEPVLESEPIQQAVEKQETVNKMQAAAAEVKAQADQVSNGIQELAETCGNAALNASEQLADIAQKVEKAEEKMFPHRRNGLD